jgi:hypothetical protein
MRRFLIAAMGAMLVIAGPVRATTTSANLGIAVTRSQAIAGVSLSSNSFQGGAASGTVVGAISVTMSPAAPPFSGTVTLSGANAANFHIVGANLETNEVVVAGTYSINIVATEAGTTGSPFTQAETITATAHVASACPQGTTYPDDGCSGAQGNSTVTLPNLFTSPVNYGQRPPWNVAGVDYPVGPDSGPFVTPTASNLPSCASMGSGGSNNYVIINSAPCEIRHYNFNGICLGWSSSITSGTITIDNNNFILNSGCNPASTVFVGYPENGDGTGTQQVIFEYNKIDLTFSRTDTSCGGPCVSESVAFNGGTKNGSGSAAGVIFEYNYLYNGQGNVIQIDGPNSFTAENHYNLIRDFGSPGSHSDGQYTNGSSGSARVITINSTYNTTSYHNPANANGTGPYTYGSQINSGYGLVGGVIDNNTIIINYGPGVIGFGRAIYCCGSGYSPVGMDVSNNWVDYTGSYGFTYEITTPTTCHGNVNLNIGATITGSFSGGSCN